MLRGELREPKLARVVHLAECVLRSSLENSRAASASVIQPRSPDGKLCNEDPSALSLAPDSLGASGGTAFAGLKIFLSKSPTPILSPPVAPAARPKAKRTWRLLEKICSYLTL